MKNVVIILDNGHGINTKGKCSPDKTLYEWSWTRNIACDLYNLLLLNKIDAQLLTPEESDISLKERVKRINDICKEAKNANKECLLISIHINAAKSDNKWHDASGFTVWVSNNASEKSKKFAQLIENEAVSLNLKGNRSLTKEGYWASDFYILKNSNCPAVLTENMFQDNKEDVEFLLSEEGKNKIINLHFNAINAYINT